MNKLQTILGIGLITLSVLGFVLMVILSIPSETKIAENSKPLQNMSADFLSDSNPTIKRLNNLKVSGGVPVTVNQGNLGRGNVFEGF